MFRDLLGKERMKLNLHMHTTLSDGHRSPEEAADIYRSAGYDTVAFTDHWRYGESRTVNGLRILSGAEYNVGGADGAAGVFHIVALGCQREPKLPPDPSAQEIVHAIQAAKGLAVLAHPAWSINTVDQLDGLQGVEAIEIYNTEIYNTVSEAGESDRAYSGHFVDAAACRGHLQPLLASDDTHYYDGSDEARASILLECAPDADDQTILQAIREKRFFATLGPEVHLLQEGNGFRVLCSPATKIALFSNLVWAAGHTLRGEGLTELFYTPAAGEQFLRAEVTDAFGRRAWSNPIKLA